MKMKGNEWKNSMDTRERISILWIVVMFTMAFADILTFVLPEATQGIVSGNTETRITQELLLIMAVLVEIPILMIYFTKTLNWKINRILNAAAAVVTIIFVIGGGSLYLHYIFFAAIETICMLRIVLYAVKWKEEGDEKDGIK